MSKKPQLVITLHGSSGSGKTTLAKYIKDTFYLFKDKNVIIIDQHELIDGTKLSKSDEDRVKTVDVVIICRQVDWRLP